MEKHIPECDVIEVHEDVVKGLKEKLLTQNDYNDLSTLFKMFGDPTRLKLLSALFENELCVCDLTNLLDMTQSAISHQLSVLRQNRIIKYRKSGKNVYYSLDDDHIQMIYNAGLHHIMEGRK